MNTVAIFSLSLNGLSRRILCFHVGDLPISKIFNFNSCILLRVFCHCPGSMHHMSCQHLLGACCLSSSCGKLAHILCNNNTQI